MKSRIEFYGTPAGEAIIVEGKNHIALEMSNISFITEMLAIIKNYYPEADKALSEAYNKSLPNRTYYEFLKVRRFIMCNFFEYDNRADIDENGTFHFEFVPCPLRGECKYCGIICNPKFNTSLSKCELQVMKMYFLGKRTEEIADELYRSIETIKCQKRNALKKLNLNSITEFLAYAQNNKLFQNDTDCDR